MCRLMGKCLLCFLVFGFHHWVSTAPFQKELTIVKTTLKIVYTFCNNLVLPVPETLS